MLCIHICNDFLGSKVHKNLYEKLDKRNVNQIIFYPKRNTQPRVKEKKLNLDMPGSKIIASDQFRTYHRIFFRLKIRSLYKDLRSRVNLKDVNLSHATTLFSDGAVAYNIFKEYHIPYIVSVRSTDINVFFNYRPDLRSLGHEILKNAKRIVFVGKSLKKNFFSHHVIKSADHNYESKSIVINNGIDHFWLDNISDKKDSSPRSILFVGRFVKRKKIPDLVDAFTLLKKKYQDLELNLVGERGKDEKKVSEMAKKNKGINFHGPIFNKKELLNMYRDNHIFAMPSLRETFGLVYVEALSQGLPILYTQGDGFDGIIENKIGEAINPDSTENIAAGLEKIMINYQKYKLHEIDFSKFNWKKISIRYKNLYKAILKETY